MVNIRNIVIYDSVKRIPNVKCACCGDSLIDYDKLKKSWSMAEKPLSKVIDKNLAWLEAEHPVVFSLLKGVASEQPTKSIDKLMIDKRIYAKMRDAVDADILAKNEKQSSYQLKKHSSNLVFDIFEDARARLRKAPVVMKKFEKFKKYLKDEKLKTFEQLQIYAEKYPRKTLSEIVQMDDVYAFHAKKNIMDRAEKREILDFHFSNIEKMIKKKSPESVERFQNLKDEVMEMFSILNNSRVRVVKMKEMYSAALKECGCEKLEKRIFAELDAIPKSFVTSDSFFVYARNNKYSDGEIIASLFNPKVASTEHVVPRSTGGKDEFGNFTVMCRSCNLSRGSNSYNEHLNYYPELKRNTEKQVKMVANKIVKDQMAPEYRFYPMEVSRTLKQYTDGKINPNISEYCEKMIEKSDKQLSANVNKLQEIKVEKWEVTQEKHRLKQQLYEAGKKLDNLDAQADVVAQSNIEQRQIQNAMLRYLDTEV